MSVKSGSWVQIELSILEPGERASNVPADTAATALKMRTKGFLQADADIGDDVSIKTIIGRTFKGKMIALNPPYQHGFGAAVPELLHVAEEMRR